MNEPATTQSENQPLAEHRQLQADAALTEAEIQRQIYGENPHTPQTLMESWGYARFQRRPRSGEWRHDSYHQTAHQLARHGWKGAPADRVTGYRGRNDQMRREHDMGASMRALGRSYDVNPSAVSRAIKEAKHRAVAVSEAIFARMASSPAAEVEFLFSVPPVLRTVGDPPSREEFFSSPLFSTSRIVAKVDNNLSPAPPGPTLNSVISALETQWQGQHHERTTNPRTGRAA